MSSQAGRSLEGRALDLILAIDRIRDTAVDEREMAAQIVRTLAEAVQAELCVLCLTDDETGELDLHTLTDGLGALAEPGAEQPLRELAQQFSRALMDNGVFAMAIGFPTVPQGKARIRVMLSAAHSREDLDMGLAAFATVGKKLGVIH